MKRITLLGSTGSIGKSSLDVISRFPDQFKAQYLSANDNVDLLAEQAKRFKPRGVAIANQELEPVLREKLRGESIEVLSGKDALCDVASRSDTDFVIGGMVGFSGLKPTIEALKAGKDVGLANKETLVVAGEIVTNLSKQYGGKLLPIDSEHSAIFQCLVGENIERIGKIILTASGGPFRTLPKEQFAEITIERALNHPNWKMGKKITIDSATLMNKGLEVIEAKWLFGVAIEQIEVVVHPQSIIHSMVEFCDGSIKAQLGTPDMKIPIQYALTYPDRLEANYPRIDWKTLTRLDFETPDTDRFRCLSLAFESIKAGGSYPCVLNAANEVAVDLFLNGRISFLKIPELIEQALDEHSWNGELTIESLIEHDAETRQAVYEKATCTVSH
ncbi:MAG: 1-deoxy-D-xylulose-5-phosphate reductoisomerase [Chloroherpetonaceae bacterium]